MADYYSILNKTISGLKDNTPELRQTVYARARVAIDKQLRQLNPAPSEEAIKAQLVSLEDAISTIEAEYFAASLNEAATAPSPEPVVDTPPEPEVASESVVETAAMPEPTTATPVVEAAAMPEPATATPIDRTVPITQATEPVTSSVSPVEPEVATEAYTTQPAQSEPQALSPSAEPVQEPVEQPGSITPPPVAEPSSLDLNGPDKEVGVPPELVSQATQDAPKRNLTPLVLGAVLLLMIGGGGYAAWLNRAALSDGIASLTGSDQEEQVVQTEETPTPESTDEQVTLTENEPKEDVRITSDGTEEEVQPVRDVTSQATDEVPVITPSPAIPDATDEQEQTAETEATATEESEQATEGAVEPTEGQTAVSPSPLGEVAYLYEEGSAGEGATRAAASVSWEIVQLKPSEALPPEPVIVGKMEVPEKGLSVDLNIKRNVDEALSASHIIEISFEIPAGFSGGGIDNIARFVMKPTEQARGEQLVAVPVKVNESYFLIALDNLDQAVRVNRGLMLNASWIDIPLNYTTGKRALLTLEKGDSGTAVFRQAFDDWENR